MAGILYATGGHHFLRMYLWWSLCTLPRLLACQVRITAGDWGLCCWVHVTSFAHELTPLFVDCISLPPVWGVLTIVNKVNFYLIFNNKSAWAVLTIVNRITFYWKMNNNYSIYKSQNICRLVTCVSSPDWPFAVDRAVSIQHQPVFGQNITVDCLLVGAQGLWESGGGRPGLPSLIIPTVSVDVKQHLKKKK